MKVLINTGSRLHFGFYRTTGGKNVYGGLGISIDKPSFIAEVEKNNRLTVSGVETKRVHKISTEIINKFDLPGAKIFVKEILPSHVGLGSTTQITLGIAQALNILYDLSLTIDEIASLTSRGLFSGIGVNAFKYGGFIIDSGRRIKENTDITKIDVKSIPKPIFNAKIPEEWRFILIIPKEMRGLDEKSEKNILLNIKPIPEEKAKKISKIILYNMLPAILWNDIEVFGKSLTEIQILIGEYFKPYQGGVYFYPMAKKIIEHLSSLKVYGFGQSSWGPTLYALTTKREEKQVLQSVRRKLLSWNLDCLVLSAKPRNHGAILKVFNS